MDVKLGYSGQLSANAQITTEKTYYKGAILKSATAGIAYITIHNCSAAGTPSAANMVAEVSTPATDGAFEKDNPDGVIECPDGIRVVKISGTIKYHIRYAVLPG